MRSKPASAFAERVHSLVAAVPHGRVITYGAIAHLLGDPRKARQVGWAMATTPERPVPIPAHRVIKARGELAGGTVCGGYTLHRARLEAEGVTFLPDGRVDLDAYLWLPDELVPSSTYTKIRRLRADGTV